MLAPARVGPRARACRGPSTAGRRARGRRPRAPRPRGVGDAHLDRCAPMRAAVRASASARPGWRSTATTAPRSSISAARVRGLAARRGAQVEHALARLRREHAGDRHRGARLRHERALLPQRRAERVERRLEHQRLGQARRRGGSPRAAAAASSLGAWSGARWRAAPPRPGGCRPPSARARRPARARRTTARRSTRGCEWRSGRLRRRAPRAAPRRARGASRAARRSTALTSPAPRGASALASSTDSLTAACGGDAVQERELEDARGAARRAPAGSSRATGRPRQLVDQVVERRRALDGPVGELGGERAVARVEARARRPPRAAPGPPTRSCSNTRRRTAYATARAGLTASRRVRVARSWGHDRLAEAPPRSARLGPSVRRIVQGRPGVPGFRSALRVLPEGVPKSRLGRTFVQTLTISLKGLIILGESAESSPARGL